MTRFMLARVRTLKELRFKFLTFPSEETGVINPKVTDHCDALKEACISLVQGIFADLVPFFPADHI